MAKRNKVKFLAGFLVLLMLVSMMPIGIFTTALAAEIDNYAVRLTDGTDLLALDDVSVTLTNKADETKTATANTQGGVAEFKGFVEENVTYTLTIDAVVGYEDVVPVEIIVINGESSRDVVLTAIEKVKVSGMVMDETGAPYAGATIRVTGYAETEAVTDDTGAYTFETYQGKEISLTVTANEEKYAVINSQATYNSDTDDVNYRFEIKTFTILTNSEDVTNGTVTPTVEDIPYGESGEVEIQADEGYRIKEVVVNGTVCDEAKDLTQYVLPIEEITENYDIRVSFYQATYTVSFRVSDNGEVTYNTDQTAPGGQITNVTVTEGAAVSFEAAANDGYHVEKVVIGETVALENGGNEQKVWSGTVTSEQINTEVLVTVEFTLNTYSINVTSAHGTYTLLNSSLENNMANYGDEIRISIQNDPGWVIQSIQDQNQNEIAYQYDVERDAYVTDVIRVEEDKTFSIAYEPNDEIVSFKDNVIVKLKNGATEIITFNDGGDVLESLSDLTPENTSNLIVKKDGNTFTLKAGTEIEFSNKAGGNIEGQFVAGKTGVNTMGWYNPRCRTLNIDASCTLTNIQIHQDQEEKNTINVQVDEKGKEIIPSKYVLQYVFIIDNTAPGMEDLTEPAWTNASNVTISGRVDDENELQDPYAPSSGLSHIVWSKDESLTADAVLAETENKTVIAADGTYSFTSTDGEQNSTYYVYAVDIAGNVSDAVTVQIKIDQSAPKVTAFAFDTEENGTLEKIINFATFGTICKENMSVTVTATDEGDFLSGVQKISLYKVTENGDVLIGETLADGNNSAVFELTAEEFREAAEIYAVATDAAGNQSDGTRPKDENVDTQANSNKVQIVTEKDLPAVTITPEVAEFTEAADPEKLWYNDDVAFTVAAYDNASSDDVVIGIQSIAVSINGTSLTQDAQGEDITQDFSSGSAPVEELEFSFSTTQVEATEGQNTIEVVVTNAAGASTKSTIEVYIDRTAPNITGYSIAGRNDTALDRVLNFLTFGIFFNEQVEITVTAEDENPSAGVRSITLYLDDEKTGFDDGDAFATTDALITEGGKYQATFVIPAKELEENDVFSANIGAKATDNVGNTTEDTVCPDTENSNIANSNLMLETVLPIITPSFAEPAAVVEGKDWYANDVEFTVQVKDADSGLRYTGVTINNGELLVDDHYDDGSTHTERYDATYTVTTAAAERADDGSYIMNVSVTDNAGNVRTYEKTIYKDIDQPYITKFDFAPVNYIEGDEENTSVKVTNYGFYFKEDTAVTIFAADVAPSSGVRSITYYTVDYTEDTNGVKSEETTVPVGDDNAITITIPANFKGQIYAKATDNVNNTTENFVTPDGAIVEDANKHNEETHIAFEKAETTFAANDGTELYAEDVDVTLTVTDTYSGIREIEWSVVAPYDTENNQNGKVTLQNDMTVSEGSETDWTITKTEANLATEMQKTITVHNNSNNIVVYVKMTDRAGNTSEDQIEFSIDKTAPVIQIVYDNNTPDAEYQDFFNADRTATVTVTERNFNSEDVICQITNTDGVIPTLSAWEEHKNTENPDETYYTATVSYTADGDYTFNIRYADLAQNAANTVPQHKFTIDKTLPRVSVVYDNNNATNGNYYNASRTATITITEHNFDAARVNVLGVATDNGAASAFPAISGWTSNGDVHIATIQYSADSRYTFDMEFLDKAGNSIADYVPEEFYVDMTAPNLEISGVADRSANNGDIAPVITYSDTNFNREAVEINLSGIHNGPIQYAGSYADIANGQIFTYANFEKVQSVDDIYTLTTSVTDMAGNTTEMTISFSANRFGSVYDLSDVENILGQYLQTEQDIVFTETNVDSLDRGGILIKLTKNGTPIDLVEGTDYSVEVTGGNGQWSVYRYTIFKSLFADDGRYSISIYSVDAAGNVNENINESKNAEISFGVDKTAPVIVPVDLESGEQYPVEEKTVSIEIKDNLVLENVKIYLNGKEIEYTVEGEVYTFNIPASNSVQDVRIVATDAAGNEYELLVEDFLVSTNLFVRWYNNTPLFIGSIVGIVVLVLALIALILFKKKKKDEEND